MYDKIKKQANEIILDIIEKSHISEGDIFVIGCSSSTVAGQNIGTASNVDISKAIFDGIYPELTKRGIFLAAQCCEHLNRAIITEKAVAILQNREIVNAVPQPKAGGSFAAVAYHTLKEPVALEHISADAGMDIGGVLIGMHLKEVAVPINLTVKKIGEANVTAARTRAKFIGGDRTQYDDKIK